MKKYHLIFLSLLFLLPDMQAKRPLLPWPQQVEWDGVAYPFTGLTLSLAGDSEDLFRTWLMDAGIPLVGNGKEMLEISLAQSLRGVPVNPEESYSLRVEKDKIHIEAITEQGVYWAIQTLAQLAEQSETGCLVQGCTILDWPAFRVRGFMQDVGRTYISLDELKREIRQLSRYKINIFHWHLTENQAWRLESKRFPELTDPGNITRRPGLVYTQEEARELVRFCRSHQVLLIPEVDMPGHSAPFVRAFGHDMQSTEGMEILKQLMDEVCEVFNEVPYLHIGTDEVEFTNPDFVPEMVDYIRNKGKKVIAWNPGWNFKKGEIDILQLWSYRGKPHPGIPVIDSRLHYINHYDTFADIVALFNSNIAGQQQGSPDYAGSILALWNDRLVQPEWNIVLENGLYPAMLTLAERTWRGGQEEYMYTKGSLLDPEGTEGFEAFREFEERMLWHKKNRFQGFPFAYVKQTQVKWRVTDPFPNEGDLDRSFPPEQQELKTYTWQGNTYGTQDVSGAGIYLRHVWGNTVPSLYKNPQENHTAYAWTWVWSPVEQTVGAWIEFQNYSRSEMDLPPLPGSWDYKKSRIWLNGEEIASPVWTTTHREKSNEVALGNENMVAREPILVTLQKGWNRLFMKLPVGSFRTDEVRLQKWMFTCVFVTLDGSEAVDGLIWSPDKRKKVVKGIRESKELSRKNNILNS